MKTQYIIFNFFLKKRQSPLIVLNVLLDDFPKGLKNEFETAVVNEPSVFEPLKFYCTLAVANLLLFRLLIILSLSLCKMQ